MKPLGSLLVAGVSARGNTVTPTPNDSSGFVYEVVTGGGDGPDASSCEVVIAVAQYDVPAAAAREWAKTLLTAVSPRERVVVIGAVDEHDVDYCGADGRRGSYVVDTVAMRSDEDASTPPPPPLPPGTLIAGVAAGVLSRCEMEGIAARMVVVPAPSGTAGSGRGGVGGSSPAARGARGFGFGPGFGGGADPAAVAHVVELVEKATGISIGGGGGGGGGFAQSGGSGGRGKAVPDAMRVFV